MQTATMLASRQIWLYQQVPVHHDVIQDRNKQLQGKMTDTQCLKDLLFFKQ